MKHAADFDRVARAYRWLEYASLGPILERVRWHWLDHGRLSVSRQALILGDGDGRFTTRLLLKTPHVHVTAVDLSTGMLRLLERRCAHSSKRLQTLQADVRQLNPHSKPDLVVTHFLLDCLTDQEVRDLVRRIRPGLQPGALWVVSEFAIPPGLLQWPARLLVRSLYFAFRLMTGLRVTRLPDHAAALQACGLTKVAAERFLGGILLTELWQNGE